MSLDIAIVVEYVEHFTITDPDEESQIRLLCGEDDADDANTEAVEEYVKSLTDNRTAESAYRNDGNEGWTVAYIDEVEDGQTVWEWVQ
jgi:hypothetical protein